MQKRLFSTLLSGTRFSQLLGSQEFSPFSAPEVALLRRLQIFRILLSIFITLLLSQILSIEFPEEYLAAASTLGIILCGRFLRRGWSFPSVFLLHGAAFLLTQFALLQWDVLSPPKTEAGDFTIALLSDNFVLVALWYAVAFAGTWLYWCKDWAVTLEATIASFFLIWLLGGHRNYHLDAPKEVSSLSWKSAWLQQLHIEPQHLFLILAGVATAVMIAYFLLSGKRPLFRGPRLERAPGKSRYIYATVVSSLLLFALVSFTYRVNKKYSGDISRAMQGVGLTQNAKEGESNLGFHSAMGATKQPAALVRLESDYANNPYAPMLYFREGALSQFNQRELVLAGPEFDTDVPRVKPGQPYLFGTQAPVAAVDKDFIAGLEMLLSEQAPFRLQSTDSNYLIMGLPLDATTFGLWDGVVLRIEFPGRRLSRQKLTQSVFLLLEHNAPFAVDYPTRIGLIKNPDSHRFSVAYQAISEAPTEKPENLYDQALGSPLWTNEVWQHYTRAPGSRSLLIPEVPSDLESKASKPETDRYGEDLRYLSLARKLTEGVEHPIEKAGKIIQFLSERSVYTKNPGHDVGPQGDPVAPYLFAERKRGYCVHFAHAAVFLLRLAGIPSRIGTGYLTDMQYAKDGHILLSFADRHAWPEVYIDGYGWTIFDVNPAEAENEQAPIPDSKMLEELMNKLDPLAGLETPSTSSTATEEEGESALQAFLNRRLFIFLLITSLTLFLILKAWLRYGYLLVFQPKDKISRSYSSFASQMFDLGLGRSSGETRVEHSRRLKESLALQAETLTSLLQETTYGQNDAPASVESIAEARINFQKSLKKSVPWWKRCLSFFNPASVSRIWRW